MNISEAKAFLTDLHEDRKINDPAAILKFFTDDAMYSISGEVRSDSIALPTCCGEEFRSALKHLLGDWHWVNVDFKNVLVDGDLVVCRYVLTVKHVPSGKTETTEIVDFMRMRDGRIAEMTQYVDTAHLSAVALGAG